MRFRVFQNLTTARFKASHQSRIRTADRTRPGLVPGLCFSGSALATGPLAGTQKHLRENCLNQPLRDVNPSVALYWDFENLHASLSEARLGEGSYGKPDGRFKTQEPLIDVQAIVDLAASFGPIAINRAYCNWQFFGRYRDLLLQNAMELIQLFPPGASTKNGADIRLCLDAADDIARHTHIGTVVIVSGDSDFMPLAQKIRAGGRTLVGIGTRASTNRHWARSCNTFRYYEDLMEAAGVAAPPAAD
ncbi:MAG: NYN domain-containing protein [Comamonadaceae bacterium]|nr:NYN domain-containing protein [Comamonadaceae bacterium]